MTNAIDISLGGGVSTATRALADLLPDIVAEDEFTQPQTPVEQALLLSSNNSALDALTKHVLANVLTTNVLGARTAALVYTATLFEYDALFHDYALPDLSRVVFNSRRRIIELDQALTPYYGNILPVTDWLRTQGIHPAVVEWCIDNFRLDNPINRCSTTAALCLMGAFLRINVKVTV